VWWDLRPETPAASTVALAGVAASAGAGRGGDAGEGGGTGGGGRGAAVPLVAPGTYSIKLVVDGKESVTKLTVRRDPNGALP
jgi:hypothetical protein